MSLGCQAWLVSRSAMIGCLVFLLAWPCSATEFADLHTDRDAFTPSTFCIAPGSVLTEGSTVYIENREGLPTNSYPEFLYRIGTTERFELRVGVNYAVGSQGSVVTSVEVGEGREEGTATYESSILYGFKASVTKQSGWLPESCFIMEASTPTYGDVFGTVPVGTYAMGWELPGQFRLDTSLRYAYVEGETTWFHRWGPSVVLRMPVTPRCEVHAEYFGTFTQGLTDETNRPFLSPGMHYMITSRLEIGLRVGWGLTRDAANFFSDAGFGCRF
ncbi:MAG: transporter [Planctomycetota bacterium]